MGRKSNLINDGQTRSGYIAPVERLHYGLTFEFRPVLAARVLEIDAEVGKATPRQEATILAKMIKEQLVSWDEEKEDGTPHAITIENVLRLPFQLLLKLSSIVRLASASDAVPTSKEDTADLERQLRGESVEAASRGN